MKNYKSVYWLLMPVLVFAILYVYFLPFETKTIYGDDLAFYRVHFKLKSVADWINCIDMDQKFRPVTSLLNQELIFLFDKDLHLYYVFNIAVQTIITTAFALIIDLLLSAPLFSFFIGILVGTSRFAYYNVSQVFWGGPMEGLAMIFFLWMLYMVMKTFVNTQNNDRQNLRLLLSATIIANIAMYTHERYIILFPFIMLVAVLYPFYHRLAARQKVVICSASVLSMLANFMVKKYIYGFPFFVGTGGQHINFSIATAAGFLYEGLLSLLQINTGGEMLVGNSFTMSEGVFQLIAVVLVLYMAAVFGLYMYGLRKKTSKDTHQYPHVYVIGLLVMLLLLSILPAIATIRLEQRWLQAPFSVFILMLVVAFCNVKTHPATIKNASLIVFTLIFILSDHNYLYRGARKLFGVKSHKTACTLRQAAVSGRIRQDATNLVILEDWWLYSEWVIQSGYLFDFYQCGTKHVTVINDLHIHDNGYKDPIKDIQPKDQVLRLHEDSVVDITDQYVGAK